MIPERLLPKNEHFRVYTLNLLQHCKMKGNYFKFKRARLNLTGKGGDYGLTLNEKQNTRKRKAKINQNLEEFY